MTIGEKIKKRRKELGISAETLAKVLKVDRSTVFRYEKEDIEKFPSNFLNPLSKALGVKPSYFTHDDDNNEQDSPIFKVLTKLPFYNDAVSAGGGTWLSEGHDYEWEEFPNVPKNADFALKVRGDSMEPMYSDGDVVFVKQGVFVEPWQVGVFVFNGDGYMKHFQSGKLVSTNTKYKPIAVGEEDSFYMIGRVIGKAKE